MSEHALGDGAGQASSDGLRDGSLLPPLAPGPDRTFADLRRWRSGDARAFDEMWARYEPALQILAFGRLRRMLEPAVRAKVDPLDVVQDAAIVALRRLHEFEWRGPGSLLAWITRIVELKVEEWGAYWRAGRRHPRVELQDSAAPGAGTTSSGGADPAAIGHGAATNLDLLHKRKRLAAAMSMLSERWQTILYLRYFGGAEWAEIAEQVHGQSADAVRVECNSRVLPALIVEYAKAKA